MLRSILVALDGSASSVEAGRLALALAGRADAHVEGLGIVNSAWIQRPEPVPLGGMAYKTALDLRSLQGATGASRPCCDSSARRRRTPKSPRWRPERSMVIRCSRSNSKRPRTTSWWSAARSLFDVDGELHGMPACVDRIVRGEPRPVLLVPQALNGNLDGDLDAPVLVAFDGSPAASRALHMFALLELSEGQEIHVLTIDNSSETAATATASRACALLRRHGVTKAHAIGLGDRKAGTPAETILGTAKALGVGMIVMGAYGHSGIREIFGSCTRAVLADCHKILFLYH